PASSCRPQTSTRWRLQFHGTTRVGARAWKWICARIISTVSDKSSYPPIVRSLRTVASRDSPCFLFVPASGPAGAGEYMRCRILAEAIEHRWPNARIHFVLNRHASYARECPYETRLLEASPAHATESVNAYIRELTPNIVIFDSTGRAAQLAAARSVGARCVF